MADAQQTSDLAIPKTNEEFRAILKRTQAGDQTTLPIVRKMLENPAYIAAFGGNLTEQVIYSFTSALAGKDLGFREAVMRKLEVMRAELLGDNPTPIERLLVERIAACWLQVQDAEMRYAQNQGSLNLSQADYHQRRMDAANRRFLAAVKALALVRKLAVPALQINVAKKQVNVVAPAIATLGATS
ncbi:MAG: hypothetical protein L0241_29435 [Planctomycetia bacterium]|nr:hypothetical protein [Planctomycetia bacterium]